MRIRADVFVFENDVQLRSLLLAESATAALRSPAASAESIEFFFRKKKTYKDELYMDILFE